MAAKLSFKTIKTQHGPLHIMRIEGGGTKLTEGADFLLFKTRPVAEYLSWVGPALLAENGTAFRIGRNVAKTLVAWKSVKISKPFGFEAYRMRSSAEYKGDRVTSHKRTINGNLYTFTRIVWGDGSVTIRAYAGTTTHVLHEWTQPHKEN